MRAIVSSLPLALACSPPQPLDATGVLSTETLHSEAVDDPFVLRVRVPEAPGPHPLVLQLDPTFAGLQQFDHTVGLVSQRAASGAWPEAIVVGVDYADPSRRFRDYTLPEPPREGFDADEGADRFYAALRDEVMPHLRAAHDLDGRTFLLGHSNGAVFAWYAALRHRPDAPTFVDGVVCADGGYPEALFTYERWMAEAGDDLPVAVHATRATFNGPGQQVTFDAFLERLEGRGHAGLRLHHAVYETDHGGAVVPSYDDGLDVLFAEVP